MGFDQSLRLMGVRGVRQAMATCPHTASRLDLGLARIGGFAAGARRLSARRAIERQRLGGMDAPLGLAGGAGGRSR